MLVSSWRILVLRRAALTVLLSQVAPEDLAALKRVAETIAAALPEDARGDVHDRRAQHPRRRAAPGSRSRRSHRWPPGRPRLAARRPGHRDRRPRKPAAGKRAGGAPSH